MRNNSSSTSLARSRPYYELVRDEIRANIESGRMAEGLTLYEVALADRLGVSRPPVKRALQLLVDEGLVHRLEGRGYVVGSASAGRRSRANLHNLDLDVSDSVGSNLGRPSWKRIVDRVEDDILSGIPFGTFQVSESVLGDTFGVSRTVVRDVLSRLHGRGLLVKDRRSHWIAGPLGARMLDDTHAVRRLLEPAALAAAAPDLDRAILLASSAHLDRALQHPAAPEQVTVESLETDLHHRLLAAVRNARLLDAVRRSQISLVVNRLFGTYIGVHDETDMLREHRLVYDHLLLGDAEGARLALQVHLDRDHGRARARLKVLSLFDDAALAPFLLRIH